MILRTSEGLETGALPHFRIRKGGRAGGSHDLGSPILVSTNEGGIARVSPIVWDPSSLFSGDEQGGIAGGACDLGSS